MENQAQCVLLVGWLVVGGGGSVLGIQCRVLIAEFPKMMMLVGGCVRVVREKKEERDRRKEREKREKEIKNRYDVMRVR